MRNLDWDDLSVANAFTAWMRKQGWGAYCDRYMSLQRRFAAQRGLGLEESKGLQEIISAMLILDGEMDVSTYFSALTFKEEEIKQKKNDFPKRATSRRGDH